MKTPALDKAVEFAAARYPNDYAEAPAELEELKSEFRISTHLTAEFSDAAQVSPKELAALNDSVAFWKGEAARLENIAMTMNRERPVEAELAELQRDREKLKELKALGEDGFYITYNGENFVAYDKHTFVLMKRDMTLGEIATGAAAEQIPNSEEAERGDEEH